MHTLHRHSLLLACCLSGLAGCIDAIGFLTTGGYFVSFMSGNSTRLAVGLGLTDWQAVLHLMALIGSFVGGAMLGAIVRHRVHAPYKAATVLMAVTWILVLAIICEHAEVGISAMLLVAVAMGAVNATVQTQGEDVVGVTYMTGALVKLGQRLAAAFHGGSRLGWLAYFLAWVSLVSGGVIGTLLFARFALDALWFPAVAAGSLSLLMVRRS